MMYELPLNPPVDKWEEYDCPKFIEGLIQDIVHDIDKKGFRTKYNVFYDMLYMHIYENIDKFYENLKDDIIV